MIVKIPDFVLEPKDGGRYEVHFNYKDTFYFLNEKGFTEFGDIEK